MVSISPESYDEGLYTQIFSQFYVIFSLSYKLINPSSENIATVLSPTVHFGAHREGVFSSSTLRVKLFSVTSYGS